MDKSKIHPAVCFAVSVGNQSQELYWVLLCFVVDDKKLELQLQL
jgi:hypothetical protein